MRRGLAAALVALTALLARPASAEEAPGWRDVLPENLVLIDVAHGRIAIELAPDFAPRHAERFRALVRAGFYDGQHFYRVIDGFVAQGGIGEGDDRKLAAWPALAAEMERPRAGLSFTSLASPDLFAKDTGFVHGFAAASDGEAAWMVHCPGLVAMARDDAPDTGATEFYVVIGHAPRRLDRIMSGFGRVIDGMAHVQALARGDPEVESGVIQDLAQADAILKATVAADLPEGTRPAYQVMATDDAAFAARIEARRVPQSPFFFRKPPPVLDVCNMSVPARLRPDAGAGDGRR